MLFLNLHNQIKTHLKKKLNFLLKQKENFSKEKLMKEEYLQLIYFILLHQINTIYYYKYNLILDMILFLANSDIFKLFLTFIMVFSM